VQPAKNRTTAVKPPPNFRVFDDEPSSTNHEPSTTNHGRLSADDGRSSIRPWGIINQFKQFLNHRIAAQAIQNEQ